MTKALDRTFTALADPTRRAVVDLLRRSPRRASEIADALGTSRPAMSRHLARLRASGLVEARTVPEDARVRVFALRRRRFAELHGWIERVEATWNVQLVAFQAHVERRAREERRG